MAAHVTVAITRAPARPKYQIEERLQVNVDVSTVFVTSEHELDCYSPTEHDADIFTDMLVSRFRHKLREKVKLALARHHKTSQSDSNVNGQ